MWNRKYLLWNRPPVILFTLIMEILWKSLASAVVTAAILLLAKHSGPKVAGAIGATLTTFGFVPQIRKMHKRKSSKDVSGITLFQFSIGVSLWAVYGFYLQDVILITANIVTLATLLIALFLYFKYRKN